MKAAGTGAVFGRGLVPILTRTEFVTVGVGPSFQVRAVASDMQVGQIDQAFGDRGGDEDGVEHFFERALIRRQSGEIGMPRPKDHRSGGVSQEPLG
jgi:hypothetical protein